MQLTRLSFVLATCSSTLYATDTAIELPTVNVQATAPARTVSEIGAAQIEREQPADLKALLKNQPGVAVSALQRTRQGNDSVNIRGLSGNRVGMSMDGIPLPEAQESRIFASAGLAFGRGNFIEPTALRATTIARGAEAEGLAGSVQFKTLEPADVLQNENFGAYVQSGYQSTDSSRHIGGGAAASTGIWQGMLMGTYRLGHETDTRGHVGGDGQSRTEADPQDYNSRYFLTKHHFQIAPEHRLSLTGEHLRRHQWLDQRSQLGTYTEDHTRDSQTRNRLSLAHRYQSEEEHLQQIDSQIYWQDSRTDNLRQRSNSRSARTDTGAARDLVWGVRSEALSHINTGRLNQDWRYGLQFARHDLRYNAVQTPAANSPFSPIHDPSADTVRTTAALYADGNIDFETWLLQPGLRADYYQLSPDTADYQQISSDIAQVQKQHRYALSPRIGAVWKHSAAFQPYAQYSRGFHAPSSQQISSSWGINNVYSIIGNARLKPEYADNFEIGVRGNTGTVEYRLAAFNNLYKNFIDYKTQQTYIPGRQLWLIQYHNFDRARIYGAEMQAAWKFAPRWTLNGNLAFARGYTKNSADTEGSGDNNGGKQPINSILPLKLQLGAAYDTERWGGNVLLTRANGKSSDQISGNMYNPTRHYTLVDVGAYWRPTKKLSLSAGVANLFNQKYWDWGDISYLAARSTYSGSFDQSLGRDVPSSFNATNADAFTAPGRHFNVGLRYTF